MALSIDGLEPVSLGGKPCVPKIDAEMKLRLTQIKSYDESADETLAMAFPNDEKYVADFIKNKMTVIDKEILHAYLLGGDTMVSTVMNKIEGVMQDA
jgi:hypothetical protein